MRQSPVDPEQVDALLDWAIRQEWTIEDLVTVCLFVADQGALQMLYTDQELLEAVH